MANFMSGAHMPDVFMESHPLFVATTDHRPNGGCSHAVDRDLDDADASPRVITAGWHHPDENEVDAYPPHL